MTDVPGRLSAFFGTGAVEKPPGGVWTVTANSGLFSVRNETLLYWTDVLVRTANITGCEAGLQGSADVQWIMDITVSRWFTRCPADIAFGRGAAAVPAHFAQQGGPKSDN